MIVEKQLTELNIGHYVIKIGKQNGNVSLTSPGHIKSVKVINRLKSKSVISAFIDDSKTISNPSPIEKPKRKATKKQTL